MNVHYAKQDNKGVPVILVDVVVKSTHPSALEPSSFSIHSNYFWNDHIKIAVALCRSDSLPKLEDTIHQFIFGFLVWSRYEGIPMIEKGLS